MIKKLKVTLSFEIPYDNEDDKKIINKQASVWIRDNIVDRCSYIPYYVKEDGDTIECATRKLKNLKLKVK